MLLGTGCARPTRHGDIRAYVVVLLTYHFSYSALFLSHRSDSTISHVIRSSELKNKDLHQLNLVTYEHVGYPLPASCYGWTSHIVYIEITTHTSMRQWYTFYSVCIKYYRMIILCKPAFLYGTKCMVPNSLGKGLFFAIQR